MADREEIAGLIEPVARHFWAEPNRTLSSKKALRWGANGGRSVDLQKGVWFDHTNEHQTINSGGVLDLIMREGGATSHAEAMAWLEQHGFKQADPARPSRPARVNGDHPQDEAPPWEPDAAPVAARGGREIVATYDYRDMSGALLYQVVRYAPKLFRQRQPAPAGEAGLWVWGLSAGEYMRPRAGEDWRSFDAERFAAMPEATRQRMTMARAMQPCLYRLPEVRDAMEDGARVFVVEGEKDADNLWSLDVPATTVSGGAKNWRPDLADGLAGADVVVIPDNDAVGHAHAEAVAKSLRGKAKAVRVASLAMVWPDMPAKGDVSDWLAHGGNVEALYALAGKQPEYVPAPYRSKFRAVWFSNMDADTATPPVEWLVDDLLTAGDRSMIYGKSRSGKSFAAIDISMSVARGAPFIGHKVKRGGVVYQAGEGTKGILNRFRAYRHYHALAPGDALPLAILRSPINLYSGDQDTNLLIEEIKALAAEMTVPLALVVIDTLATATSGADENSARDMSPVLARVARVSEACGCHVMLVHHMGASGERPRGHTSVFANIDNALEVSLDEGSKIRTMKNTKQKDEAEAPDIRFELMRVVIGRREDGREISSCVVLPLGEKSASRTAFRLNDTEGVFFRALMAALLDGGIAPPAGLGLPQSVRVVVDYAKLKDKYARLVLSDGDDPKEHKERLKKALSRARTTLSKFGVVGVDNPYIWWTGKPVQGFARAQAKLRGGGDDDGSSEQQGDMIE